MKTIVAIFFAICLLGTLQLHATVWRVNNNTGIDADTTTLAGAVALASAGDTIYLESSPNNYGGATINKRLVIIGPGYFLNNNDSTQAHKQPAWISPITINAAGTVIQGISYDINTNSFAISVQADSVTIRRCYLRAWAYGTIISVGSGLSDIRIMQNFIRSWDGSNNAQICVGIGANTTAIIQNNWLYASNTGSTGKGLSMNGSVGPCVVKHNVIRGWVVANNSNYTNNIHIAGNFTGSNNQEDYNMCDGTQYSGANSIQNANMNNIFINNGGGFDKHYQLACPGGPDDGCSDGEFGHDMGMFGGPSSYKLSGIPDIPAIFQFGGTGSASDNTPLQINIKAKSHN